MYGFFNISIKFVNLFENFDLKIWLLELDVGVKSRLLLYLCSINKFIVKFFNCEIVLCEIICGWFSFIFYWEVNCIKYCGNINFVIVI